MKKLVYKLLGCFAGIGLILFSYFSQPSAEINKTANIVTSSAIPDSQLIIGAFDDGAHSLYDTLGYLGFNTWHHYVSLSMGWNYDTSDNYLAPTTQYQGIVTGKISDNIIHHMRTFMERPVIQYVIAGQRIDYQCESIPTSEYYWFWAYNNSFSDGNTIYDTDDNNSQYGTGERVKFCMRDNSNPGSNACWLDTGIRANRELSFTQTNAQMRDDAWDWYVMPRIRIDSAYAAGTAHNEDTICRIRITGWNGYIVKDISILVENFKQSFQGIYSGDYLDVFHFYTGQDSLFITKDLITQYFLPSDPSWALNYSKDCKVDIKIYWAGKCDTWFDRIRLENDPAHQYLTLTDQTHQNLVNKVNSEITWSSNTIAGQIPNYFYFEECQMSHFPAIKTLNEQIMTGSGNSNNQIVFLNPGLFRAHMSNWETTDLTPAQYKKYLYDDFGLRTIVFGDYPFGGEMSANPNGVYYYGSYSLHPRTLLDSGYDIRRGRLSYVADREVYESWVQGALDKCANKAMDYFTKNDNDGDIRAIYAPQADLWYYETGSKWKEPSNEELQAETYIPLTCGAKGIMYFGFTSAGQFNESSYSRGLMEYGNYEPRHNSVYHQDKYGQISEISKKLKKWSPYLMKFSDASRKSYAYHLDTERASMQSSTYFNQFVTLRPAPIGLTVDCNDDFIPTDISSGWINDCQDATYLQVATFGSIEANSQYFMIVNRRCSPYINDNSDDNIGGHRKVRMYLHSNHSAFSGFNNWSIINCYNDSIVATFNKTNPGYINLDYFMPGEGKLFKIAPVMETGGTLNGDESIDCKVTCKNNIYNNGYDITIGTNANMYFSDTVGIYMTGGNLRIGNSTTTAGSNFLHFQGSASGKTWKGFVLEDCDTVEIYGAKVQNIIPNYSAVSLTNCYKFKIDSCTFTCASGDNSAGISVYYNTDAASLNTYQYIWSNTFNFTSSSEPAVQVNANAGISVAPNISYNTFSGGSATGIMLTNITGGTFSGNTIGNYSYGFILLSSTGSFYNNTISSSANNSKGIQLIISEANDAPAKSQGYFVGGNNYFSATGSSSYNIYVTDSYFNIDEGYNVFNIDFSNSTRHISGYFPDTSALTQNATYNCFENNYVVDTASIFVTQGNEGDRITFNTNPTYCSSSGNEDYVLLNLPGGVNDTLYLLGGGEGGAYNDELKEQGTIYLKKSIHNTHSIYDFLFTIYNFPFSGSLQNITSYKILKDSLNVNIRKHNYSLAELECKELLMYYPNVGESIGAISKLYLSSLSLDSAGSHIQPAKTFLETLILNNSTNSSLIKRANYFVQKCKVSLKQYTSALQGFQEIINQNPYSYEGLIASWDYAATQLLANSGGAFSSSQRVSDNDQFQMYNVQSEELSTNDSRFSDIRRGWTFDVLHEMLDSLKTNKSSIKSYTNDSYDTKKFSKTDRETINTNVTNAFSNERSKQIDKLKNLESKITSLTSETSKTSSTTKKKQNENMITEAKKELKTMKSLGEVVKVKNPKTKSEHVKIINSDIKKVFETDKLTGSKGTTNNIPTEFNLSQNYPNPFNPVTKINYDLPKDGKVKLVIYDILGREMKTLINEIKQAGRYTIEFNGNNFASGIYFYRIQVDCGTSAVAVGKSYTAVKKMVLVK